MVKGLMMVSQLLWSLNLNLYVPATTFTISYPVPTALLVASTHCVKGVQVTFVAAIPFMMPLAPPQLVGVICIALIFNEGPL